MRKNESRELMISKKKCVAIRQTHAGRLKRQIGQIFSNDRISSKYFIDCITAYISGIFSGPQPMFALCPGNLTTVGPASL